MTQRHEVTVTPVGGESDKDDAGTEDGSHTTRPLGATEVRRPPRVRRPTGSGRAPGPPVWVAGPEGLGVTPAELSEGPPAPQRWGLWCLKS